MKETLQKYLSSIGFAFPESEEEIKSFDEVHEDHDFMLSEEDIDPYKILKEIQEERKPQPKIRNIDYHKRTVLAAEIVYQLRDDFSLGRLKLQKIIFLCQNTTKMSLHTSFLKQAMGPYDPKLMRSLESQFQKNKWFEYCHDDFPKYKPLENCGNHKKWYDIYFSEQDMGICFVIDTLKKFKTHRVELIGTLFACWQEVLKDKEIANNQVLIKKVYAWHKSKSKFFAQEIMQTISWMKEKGIYPQ